MDWKTVKDKLLSDPEVKAEYEALKPEYEAISALAKEVGKTACPFCKGAGVIGDTGFTCPVCQTKPPSTP